MLRIVEVQFLDDLDDRPGLVEIPCPTCDGDATDCVATVADRRQSLSGASPGNDPFDCPDCLGAGVVTVHTAEVG
jgi:hypothetical protein